MNTMDVHQDTMGVQQINDFELYDFIDNPNFDQFINLIRGENENNSFCDCDFGSDMINNCFGLDNNQLLSCPGNPIFDQPNNNNNNGNNNNAVNVIYDPNPTLRSFSYFDGAIRGEDGEEEEINDGAEDSSAITITPSTSMATGPDNNATPRLKTDRSKTLISERRRRGRMKEKLYTLRSLVPNITKMDKASIIGDAVSYVHDLQAQAKKLKAEVAGLEASLLVSKNYQGSNDNPMEVQVTHSSHPICKKIMQLDMFQVEERGYYVKIVCNKGEGVASSLYRALESLAGFSVQNSNLATVCDRFLLTFTLNVRGSEPEINLPNLKLWVTGALLNRGFEIMTPFHA